MKTEISTLVAKIWSLTLCLATVTLVTGCSDGMTTAPQASGILLCEKLEMFPSGHVSCIRIHNGFRAQSFPTRNSFCVFAQVPGNKDGFRYQYKIKDTNGDEIDKLPTMWSEPVPIAAFSHKVGGDFRNVEFPHEGQYDVVLEINSKPAGKASLCLQRGEVAAANQSANQPASQTANQPANQAANQPASPAPDQSHN